MNRNEQIRKILKEESNEAFNNGLSIGLAALKRAIVHLKVNPTLIEPLPIEKLIQYMENDLEDLTQRFV